MIDFSVHLITYNNSQHIQETLESILKQEVDFTYEIVVGDDSSSDDTFDIIKQFQKQNPQLTFHIVKNESQLGILKNFKSTLDRCTGTYVLPLAGDDFLKPNTALQQYYDTFNADRSLGFVDCGFDNFHSKTGKFEIFFNKSNIEIDKQTYIDLALIGKIAPIGFCFNRSKLLDFVDFDGFIKDGTSIDDYPILVNLIMNCNFARIKNSLIVYRIHDDSFSHKQTFERQQELIIEMKKLFDEFSRKYNFKQSLKDKFYLNQQKQLLFLAGYFSKKDLGNEVFKNLKVKSIKDYIHYLASQSLLLRRLISII